MAFRRLLSATATGCNRRGNCRLSSPKQIKQVVIAPIVDRALLAQEKNLQQLLSEYEQIANAQARRDRLVGLRQLLKGKLRSLASIQTAFQSVHLPTEQLVEVVEQLERLLGPDADRQHPFF
jgi:hypothetical protein